MQFQYTAYTLSDGLIKGKIEADTETEARLEITRLGYKALEVKVKRELPGLEQMFPSLFKVGTGELIRFSRQLALIIRGGSSLQRGLELLQSESSNKVMRRVLDSVRKTVDGGGSLSAGMAENPAVFGPRYVSVVESGEFTGALAPALDELADSMETEYEAIQKVKRTLMMPVFTMGASTLMLVLMMTTMLPRLVESFESSGSDIPVFTRVALAVFGWLISNIQFVAIGLVLLAVSFAIGLRKPAFKYTFHLILTKTPIIGPLIVAKELAQFSRTISMLLAAGVALAMALPLAISGCKNHALHRAFVAGEESLLTGHGFSEALSLQPVLPRMWVELVLIGEESNSIGRTMDDLANAYEKEMENRLGSLVSIMEPVSTLAVGGVVLFMALSILQPVYAQLGNLGG